MELYVNLFADVFEFYARANRLPLEVEMWILVGGFLPVFGPPL
jgi:hypothetical protein